MPDPKPAPLLGRLAVHLKMISMDQLAEAIRAQGRAGEDAKLGEILVACGFIDRTQLVKLIAAQQQVLAKQKGKAPAPTPAAAPAPAPTKPAPAVAPAAPRAAMPAAPRADAAPAPGPEPNGNVSELAPST